MSRFTRASGFVVVMAAIGFGSPSPSAKAKADDVGSAMAEAARRFVGSLDETQKKAATFSFDSPERVNWHWIPRERKGLPIKGLKPDQRALAFGLLDTGLSTRGAIKATTIMSLEEILRVDEHGTGPVRDSELYYVSVFGAPSDTGMWGWRVEGHHLALNYTLHDGVVVSATPFMFGSNPAVVKTGPRKGMRNLAEIEAPAAALLASFTPEQRKLVVAAAKAPEVTTTPNSAQPVADSRPPGISVDKLDASQRATLVKLLQAYAVNFPEPIKADLFDQIARGESSVHFAWYGPLDMTKNHAFHIQSATLYVDFNNTQNGVNHIHTFVRSFVSDFGRPYSH